MSKSKNNIINTIKLYYKNKNVIISILIFIFIIFLIVFTNFIKSLMYYDILGKNGRISYKKKINNEYVDCIENKLFECNYYYEYTDNKYKDHIIKYKNYVEPKRGQYEIDPTTIVMNKNIYYSNIDSNNYSLIDRSAKSLGPFIGCSILLIITIILSYQLYLLYSE